MQQGPNYSIINPLVKSANFQMQLWPNYSFINPMVKKLINFITKYHIQITKPVKIAIHFY